MASLTQLRRRIIQSAVVWSWAFNGLRLASGLLLLPLLLKVLPTNDLGMHYVLLSLAALAPLVDFGFMGAIGRAVAYAMSGVKELQAQGVQLHNDESRMPNGPLVWELRAATRVLYGGLAAAAALLSGGLGLAMVGQRVSETQSPSLTWAALALTVTSLTWEIYTSWYTTFLYGMNRMTQATRLQTLGYAIKLVLSCGLLTAGGGLLSIPLAGLAASLVQRSLARRACDYAMADLPRPTAPADIRQLLAVLWPNSWRQGTLMVSSYLSSSATVLICSAIFGLEANAEYGLTLQVFAIASGMASVWTHVKWPEVFALRARTDHDTLRRLFWKRAGLQHLTYWGLALGAMFAGPAVLEWLESSKSLLPMPWLGLAAGLTFLETRCSLWCTLLTTENRLPSFWATVITHAGSLVLLGVLLATTELQVAALILAPLTAGAVLNYWYWPVAGARSLETRWWRFLVTAGRAP